MACQKYAEVFNSGPISTRRLHKVPIKPHKNYNLTIILSNLCLKLDFYAILPLCQTLWKN